MICQGIYYNLFSQSWDQYASQYATAMHMNKNKKYSIS